MKHKTTIIITLLLIILSFSVQAFVQPDEGQWTQSYFDSGKSARIDSLQSYVEDAADHELLCTISRTITGQPYIINISNNYYAILYGTDFVEARDANCNNVADLSRSGINAPPIMYYFQDSWRILIPYANQTIEHYQFNGTLFNYNNSYNPGHNLNNSVGACDEIVGFNYCYWQNTTNDLVRLTLETNTTTSFTGMSTTTRDATERHVAIREVSSTTYPRVVFTGENSTVTTALCHFNTATETIDPGFNSGNCVRVSTSTSSTHNLITNPAVFDIDGGSSRETGVVVSYVTGGGASWNHFTGLYVYAAAGTIKYSQVDQHTSGTNVLARAHSVYNPIAVRYHTGSARDFAFCTIGEVEDSIGGNAEEVVLICAGEDVQWAIENNSVDACDWTGTSANLCRWGTGVFNKNRGVLPGTTNYVQQGVGRQKFVTIPDNGTFGNQPPLYTGEYWGFGDLDNDAILDWIYDIGSTVYIRLGLFDDEPPLWVTTPGAGIDTQCIAGIGVNQTYTIATLTNNAYFDQDGDVVRLLVDCYGDGRENATSEFGVSGLDNLVTQCTWNETGSYSVRMYLQDPYMVATEETTVLNRLTFFITVVDDEDLICAPGSGLTLSGYPFGNDTARDSPEGFVEDFKAELDITDNWLLIAWLICTMIIIAALAYKGITNTIVLGGTAFVSFILGVIIGLIPIWIAVVVALIAGAGITFVLFGGGGD